jgi:DNA-binding MarR family transcriptional regulator
MKVTAKKAARSVRKTSAEAQATAPVKGKPPAPAKASASAKAAGKKSLGKSVPTRTAAQPKGALPKAAVPPKAVDSSAASTPAQSASAKTRADQLGIRAAALAHPFPPHDLGVAVPYLLARAGERMGNTFSKEIRPFKLTMNEWRVSVALHLQAHQRLSELAAHTSADLSTISRVIDGLIRRGLAQRDRDSEDARAVAISLTEEGRLLTEKIIPIAQLYERVALSGISEEDAEKLRTLLRKVYDNIGILNGAG